jgi:hypothetical protein
MDRVGKYDKAKTINFRKGVSLTESQLSYSATYAPALKSSISYLVDEKLVTIEDKKLVDLQNADTSLYNQAIKFMSTFRLILPPSAAVAGAITSVDGTRGVWKAPVVAASMVAPMRVRFTVLICMIYPNFRRRAPVMRRSAIDPASAGQ